MARRSVKRPAVRVCWAFSDTPYTAEGLDWMNKKRSSSEADVKAWVDSLHLA